MKQMKFILTLLAVVFISTTSFGQKNSEMYLSERWNASCSVEILDHASMRNCELCPFVINPNNKSQGELKDIEMTFTNDSILIKQNDKVTPVPYSKNKDTHAIQFMLNNKQYNFRMFIDGERRILEDADGLLLVLEKVK